jgi:aspartyl-tRNA(Asn)/glutamyl-tRNA(Gln) amidotransferase subunit B
VTEIKAGKYRKLKFFSGEVMKATKGKANPVLVDKLLKEKIGHTDDLAVKTKRKGGK